VVGADRRSLTALFDQLPFRRGLNGAADHPQPIYSLWVPETPRTSRDLLILVEQSTEPVPSSDGVRLGRRPMRE
jgi:hypothetical protein